jgi:hypothetical protein
MGGVEVVRLVCDCGTPLVQGRCPLCDGALSRPGRRASATRRAQLAREKNGRELIRLSQHRATLGARVAAFDTTYRHYRDDVAERHWRKG